MSEIRVEYEGITASDGMAMGPVVHLPSFESIVPRDTISEEEVESELGRFHASLEESSRQIERVLNDRDMADEHRAIFEAQALVLKDPMLVDPTLQKIKSELINTEWALALELDHLKELMGKTRDPFFRERVSDLEDIGNRIISNLLGIDYDDVRVPFLEKIPPGSILVAESVSPSLMLQMGRDIAGIVTEKGGVTGHMAILCRDRGIPALVGVESARLSVEEGSLALIDGENSRLIVFPDDRDRERFEKYRQTYSLYDRGDVVSPVRTADNKSIRLWVNLDNEQDAMNLHVVGVTGVGLFRTEFLYLTNPFLLDHSDEQVEVYASILKFLRGKIVTFRLLDLGDDKTLHAPIYRYAGAATDSMSLRGIRFLLANPAILQLQIEAIIRAMIQELIPPDHCRIMIPMVTRLEEIHRVKEIIQKVREDLGQRMGSRVPELPLGIMLETPAACMMTDVLSPEVDFFSLGTNDLATFTMALRRTESQKDEDQFYQPALYRMIHFAVKQSTVPVSVCGEIAGVPELIPLLTGLGIGDLSVAVSALSRTYSILSTCHVGNCQTIASRVLAAKTSQEVRAILQSMKEGRLSDYII